MCDYCQWISESPNSLKNQNEDSKFGEKKLSPIIIIHGFPSYIENPSILNLMKTTATDGYKKLIQGQESIEVVESTILQLEKSSNYSRGASIKSAILANDEGRTGCLTGFTDSCTISGARDLLENGLYPLIIQERSIHKERKNKSKDGKNKNEDGKSGCWGVIVRDKNEKITCGRYDWEFNEKYPLSIPPSTIYGCGIFIKNKSCFSLSGDEEMIYSRIPARKMSNCIKTSDKNLTSKREIMRLMSEFDGKSIGVISLGNFDRPVIFCKSEFFPWVYCSKNMMNFGSSEGEMHSEDVIWDGEINCTCHWR